MDSQLEKIKETVRTKLVAEFGEIPQEVEHNQYEARIEEKRDRYEARSEAAAARSNSAWEASHAATQHIPLGQPVLVDHHSAKRHRRDLDRADTLMRRTVEEQKKAEYFSDRADSVGSGGIDSGDPDAKRKLLMKLEGLQILQSVMKAANSIVKSKNAKKYADQQAKIAALLELGMSEAESQGLFAPDFCGRIGFAAYELSNNNANMARIKDRIKAIASLEQVEDQTHVFFGGWLTVEVNKADARIFLSNPEKPSAEVRSIYKRNGYSYSPSREAWARKLTANATHSVGTIRRSLTDLGEDNF